MSITLIFAALVISYIIVGYFMSYRAWKTILDADKTYKDSIETLKALKKLSPSPQISKDLYEIQKEREDLRRLLDRKNAYWIVTLVYTLVWPTMILKGDALYDTRDHH